MLEIKDLAKRYGGQRGRCPNIVIPVHSAYRGAESAGQSQIRQRGREDCRARRFGYDVARHPRIRPSPVRTTQAR